MSFSEHIRVAGYPYDDVRWEGVAPARVAQTAMGYHLPQHLWKGGEVQAELQGDTQAAQPQVRYAVKLDLTPAALTECRQLLAESERESALGMAMVRRLNGQAAPEDIRVPLEGLDEAHLLDCLTSAVLTWHAQTFGPGPESKQGAASRPSRRRSPA